MATGAKSPDVRQGVAFLPVAPPQYRFKLFAKDDTLGVLTKLDARGRNRARFAAFIPHDGKARR